MTIIRHALEHLPEILNHSLVSWVVQAAIGWGVGQ